MNLKLDCCSSGRKKEEASKTDSNIPTLKNGGGSIMVCGCLVARRTSALCRLDGNIKKEDFVEILQNHLKI